MENAVVDTEMCGIVDHRHRRSYAASHPYGPVEVLTPVGAVAASDVTHGTGIFVFTEQGFSETGTFFELVGEAAVANHQAKLLVVGHLADLGVVETGSAPACGAAVGGVVDESRSLIVVAADSGGVGGGAAADGDVGGAGGDDGDIILEVHHLTPAVGAVDIVGDGIVHRGVGMGVTMVACVATVDTCHHHRTVEEGGVGEGILLIHQRLQHLRCKLGDGLSGEAAIMAVGQMVARSPGRIVEVGDMVVVGRGDLCIEGGELCHIAHQEHVGGSWIGLGGVVVETLKVGGDGGRGGTHTGIIGVDDIGEESFAALPLDESVEMPTEHAVGHNDIAHGSGGADGFGIETVEGVGAAVESWRIVAFEHLQAGFSVTIAIGDGHGGMSTDHHLTAHRIVAYGRELQPSQTSVASHTHSFYCSLLFTEKDIRRIKRVVDIEFPCGSVALAARKLHRHYPVLQCRQGIIEGIGDFDIECRFHRHLDET